MCIFVTEFTQIEMDKFFKFFFSMRLMTIGLMLFFLGIGWATFLESIYDTQTARIVVYNALWFEVLLTYLCINLIGNIFEQRMFRREKITILVFHLSFIVILIGAGITRYVSFDGIMMIREGEKENFIYSSDPYLWYKINDGKIQLTRSTKMYMSELVDNSFEQEEQFPNHKNPITIEYVDFQKKMIDTLVINDSIKGTALDIITDGMKSNYLTESGFVMVGEVAISFEKKNAMPGIHISMENGKPMMTSKMPFKFLPMSEMQKARQSGLPVPEEMYVHIPVDSMIPFRTTTLYVVGQEQFVFKQAIKHAKMTKIHSDNKEVGSDFLIVKITDGKESKIVELEGGMGARPTHETFTFQGLVYEMEYGSTKIDLPFSVGCKDFQLDKYPGSEMPSSFASEVTVFDEKNKHTHDQRIFMNNVMDYGGYRFFQSAYDLDDPKTPENEEGTRLSVNHDWWGTNVSYLGYLLMGLGMVLSLFSTNGRFRDLNRKLKVVSGKREVLSLFFVLFSLTFGSFSVFSQHEGHNHKEGEKHDHQTVQKDPVFKVMSEEHSENFESLLVQDFDGRIVPLHTSCDQLLRKIYHKRKFEKLNAVQTIMSMHMYPNHWMNAKIIYLEAGMQQRLKLKKYVSFKELADKNGAFKWTKEYDAAHKKADSKKDEFEKKLIKLVERFQVAQAIFSWQYMKLIPIPSDPNNTWFVPLSMELMQVDSISSNIALQYLASLDNASTKGDYSEANEKLKQLKTFQRAAGLRVVPTEAKVNAEISYNKMNIFSKSMYSYMLIGLVLIVFFYVQILVKITPKSKKIFKSVSLILRGILFLAFVYHGVGLGFRWYITGAAPWTNGYGAIVFISWVTVLMGFLFSRKHMIIIAGAAILATIMLAMTESSLMDPDITPIQPVLKSYWLMIHVSIITGSYAPLGLACMLALFNFSLFIIRNEKNGKLLTYHITEISYLIEMVITVGLFMLTIGTFLGGIWANESWGRYWAWDPKEVWALVSVLVYAIILHLRFIPAASGKFTFNLVSFWGYASILFTYFGVNFYLKGLHSYAQGDGLGTVPSDVKIAIFLFAVLSFIAFMRNRAYMVKNKLKNSAPNSTEDELA